MPIAGSGCLDVAHCSTLPVRSAQVARMKTLAKGDVSVSVLVRLLEAAGYNLKLVKAGYER